MSKKHDATSRSVANHFKVHNIGVITQNINKAIKKTLCKEKGNIKNIEDAICIIVIDKQNRQSVLTSKPMKAMDFFEDDFAAGGSGQSSSCYRYDEAGCIWLIQCGGGTSGGQSTVSSVECCMEPPCPGLKSVDIGGTCPCEE